MTEQVSVTREVDASAEQVWAMVSDVTRMGEWSPENEGATWLGGATGSKPGVRFRGTNRNGKKQWNTVATVLDAEPGRRFSVRVTAAGLKVAEWRYTFEPAATGCRVTETWIDQRGRIAKGARQAGERRLGPCHAQPRGDGADPRAPRGGRRVQFRPELTREGR